MSSDPELRSEVLRNLQQHGGEVTGPIHGSVAAQLRPAGASMTATRRALNSLAHSTARSPEVRLVRKRHGASGVLGDVVATMTPRVTT